MTDMEQIVKDILLGSVDFHMHAHMSPDYHWNLVKLAEQYKEQGVRAVVVKNLFGSSHEQCHIANQTIGENFFYASLVLGKVTGNINRAPVETFIALGGANKIVEMPVFDAAWHMQYGGKPSHLGIKIFDGDKPCPGLIEVLEFIAEHNLVLKTGHVSPDESISLIKAAKKVGVEHIVVTHATGAPVMASIGQQAEMASMGALIEHCLIKFLPVSILRNTCSADHHDSKPKIGDLTYLKDSIRTVGPHRCVLGTDSGQTYHPLPHDLFRYFVYLLLELGFSNEEIGRMARENSCRLLGIDD
jgi:hypothetical protein